MDTKNLTALQLDALREVANIGAAHAATALSQIIEKTILINVTRVDLCAVDAVLEIFEEPESRVVAVRLKMLGDAVGGFILVWSWEDALTLAAILKKEPRRPPELSAMDISALKESGSILAAAYLQAIGDFIGFSIIPAVPELFYGEIAEVLERTISELARRSEIAFCLETEFIDSKNQLRGRFLLVPDVKGLQMILGKLV